MTALRLLRTSLLIALLSLAAAPAALGQQITTPAPGSSERAAILDSLRPAIEAVMRGPVEFVVRDIRVGAGWAFVVADPQRPGGGKIVVRETGLVNDGVLDGLTVYALLRKANGRWHHISDFIGPTDLAYIYWPEYYGVPARVLGL